MTATYIIIVPRWDGPYRVPGRLATWFKTTLDWIVTHQRAHMAIAEAFVPTIKATVLASPCDQASAEANATKALEKLQVQQDALDARTNWTWPPY
jgi:predicted secreted Zn-dependent protease